MAQLELDDIQSIVLESYEQRPSSRWALLQVTEPAAVGRWLRKHQKLITRSAPEESNASSAQAPRMAVAFTFPGLLAMGLTEADTRAFDVAFKQGMNEPTRARRLGDVADAAPSKWLWGNGQDQDPHLHPHPHLLVIVYSIDANRRSSDWNDLDMNHAGVHELQRIDGDRDDQGREYFGYKDGISQPSLEGALSAKVAGSAAVANQQVKPGEFVLGYENELGRLPYSPTVAARLDHKRQLKPDQADPRHVAFGRNGTYLVVRQLEQKVPEFNAFLKLNNRTPQQQEFLAAKLMGRWRSGAPLALAPEQDNANLAMANHFNYHADDRYGYQCPLGAHIRRANPRDALVDAARGDDSATALQRTQRHRIIRRGRRYQIPANSGRAEERGILFAAINTSIENQFEFIQRTWVNNRTFAGMRDESDPLATQPVSDAARRYTIQAPGANCEVAGLSAFVKLRGGAYFFMPGISALEFLAELAEQQSMAGQTN